MTKCIRVFKRLQMNVLEISEIDRNWQDTNIRWRKFHILSQRYSNSGSGNYDDKIDSQIYNGPLEQYQIVFC